jgi:hypothetical protein
MSDTETRIAQPAGRGGRPLPVSCQLKIVRSAACLLCRDACRLAHPRDPLVLAAGHRQSRRPPALGPLFPLVPRGHRRPCPSETAAPPCSVGAREAHLHAVEKPSQALLQLYVTRPHDLTNISQELELFAHHCRVFFWNDASSSGNVEDSGDYISRTLAKLPPAHRAAYTRVQSQMRAQAHLHHLRVRISNFHALIAANAPNSGLSGPARSDLTGRRAQSERIDRLSHFVRTWGGSAGALEPFFRGLYTTLRLQSRGETSRGGAGSHRVAWEIDDAVFLESG